MKKKKNVIVIVLLIATLCFIWIHSAAGREASSKESSAVAEWLEKVLGAFFGDVRINVLLLRKLAHFSEFALLGLEIALLSGRGFKGLPFYAVNCLIVAFIDETIQIFSGRGPAVADMWIDLSGGITGAALMSLILMLIDRKRSKAGKQ